MAISWVEPVTREQITRNSNRLSYIRTTGIDKAGVAREIGVDVRTVQRWFADTAAERRNALPRTLAGRRLYALGPEKGDVSTNLRRRSALVFPLTEGIGSNDPDDRGIWREPPIEGEERITEIDEPQLGIAIATIERILWLTYNGYLEYTWNRVYNDLLPQGGWRITVHYTKPEFGGDSEALMQGLRDAQNEEEDLNDRRRRALANLIKTAQTRKQERERDKYRRRNR